MRHTKVVTRFEMTRAGSLIEAQPVDGVAIVEIPDPAGGNFDRLRRLHDQIAAPHQWSSLSWPPHRWRRWLDCPALHHWSVQHRDIDIGWGCLRQHADHEVELDSFGLLPTAIGNGYGGHALTLLVREAWTRMTTSTSAELVWLTTTDQDHPHAAANYRARGFHITSTTSTTD